MSQITLAKSESAARKRSVLRGAKWCEECGYSLRGLAAELPCPECGHLPLQALKIEVRPHRAWSRSVFAGLALLIVLTIPAVSSVLIQPFNGDVGGAAASLNLPGPKLWAVPLLQRPIGRWPELPGVIGTRTAMLSLLAIWMLTAPCPSPRVGREQLLRLMTRWGSIALFGFAFGAVMASQEIWGSKIPPFRQALVAGVELPATTLLYLYLRQLARQVPGRDRRAMFDKLAWAAPLVVGGGAVLVGTQWWMSTLRPFARPPAHLIFMVSGLYGAAAMLVGVAATATVGGLAGTFATLAFSSVPSILRPGAIWTRLFRTGIASLGGPRGRALLVVIGLMLLLAAMVLGNDAVMWIVPRSGPAGALPFVNYPGPKMWPATAALAMRLSHAWDPLVANTTLVAVNVLAVGLMTIRVDGRPDLLRTTARVLAFITVGAGVAFIAVAHIRSNGYEGYSNKVFIGTTLASELPVTVLLYIVMARLAEEHHNRRLADRFRALAFVIVLLVSTSMLFVVLSKFKPQLRGTRTMFAIVMIYGAATLSTAAYAVTCVLKLAGVLVGYAMKLQTNESPARHSVRGS